jgi:uncharacterized protein YdeI (YjbR/CyaY-like superfamily)
MSEKPQFFASPEQWRAWLEKHHADVEELWVGLYKRASGKPSITWPQAVDGALCFGWIDGVRKSVDGISYKIRFTPRKPRSIWSAINHRRATELKKMGQMHPAGLAAFERRQENRSKIYSYEQRRKAATLPTRYAKLFRCQSTAWNFFQNRPPWYRRTSSWWVISAKKEETRLQRLSTLIECSKRKQVLPALARSPKTKRGDQRPRP